MLDTFAVIAEPRRRQILDTLSTRDATVNELVDVVRLSQPAVSKHLRVLRDHGFVTSTKRGQQRIYHLQPEPLKEVAEWIEPFRALWRDALLGLDVHLSATRTSSSANPDRSKK